MTRLWGWAQHYSATLSDSALILGSMIHFTRRIDDEGAETDIEGQEDV